MKKRGAKGIYQSDKSSEDPEDSRGDPHHAHPRDL